MIHVFFITAIVLISSMSVHAMDDRKPSQEEMKRLRVEYQNQLYRSKLIRNGGSLNLNKFFKEARRKRKKTETDHKD